MAKCSTGAVRRRRNFCYQSWRVSVEQPVFCEKMNGDKNDHARRWVKCHQRGTLAPIPTYLWNQCQIHWRNQSNVTGYNWLHRSNMRTKYGTSNMMPFSTVWESIPTFNSSKLNLSNFSGVSLLRILQSKFIIVKLRYSINILARTDTTRTVIFPPTLHQSVPFH